MPIDSIIYIEYDVPMFELLISGFILYCLIGLAIGAGTATLGAGLAVSDAMGLDKGGTEATDLSELEGFNDLSDLEDGYALEAEELADLPMEEESAEAWMHPYTHDL